MPPANSKAPQEGLFCGHLLQQKGRYLLGMSPRGADEDVVVQAKPIAYDAYVVPIDRFYAAIEDSIVVDAETLTRLSATCTARLGSMARRTAISS